MPKKVFISSVTLGLVQERTALPGLIMGLGMQPVRFEDFTAAPSPSREVCLRAVAESDIYLLLLGEHYGAPFPDTGLSPTQEEYRAAVSRGLPTLAFRRRDVTMDPLQREFAAEVEAYPSGLFRASFAEVGELLAEAGRALRDVPAATGALVFSPVAAPVNIGWRTPPDPRDQFAGFGSPGLEVYLTPVDRPLSASRLRSVGVIAPRMLREFGGIDNAAAIDVATEPDGNVTATVARARGRRTSFDDARGGDVEGLAVRHNGEICAWAGIRRDTFGAVVDGRSLTAAIVPLVALAGRTLGEVVGDTEVAVVPSVAVPGARSVTLGRPEVVGNRSGATMPMSGPTTLTLPGDESAVLNAAVTGATDVGAELAARIVHALQAR